MPELSQLAPIAEAAAAVASLIVSIIVGIVALGVHRYTQRRDKLEFLLAQWSEQQQINIAQITSADNIEALEHIVYGDDYPVDLKRSRKYFQLFLMLNQLHHLYLAHRYNIISREEFAEYAETVVCLIVRQKDVVKFLLSERGYEPGFRSAIGAMLDEVKPSGLPMTPALGQNERCTGEALNPCHPGRSG